MGSQKSRNVRHVHAFVSSFTQADCSCLMLHTGTSVARGRVVSELMDEQGGAIIALDLVSKNLIFA